MTGAAETDRSDERGPGHVNREVGRDESSAAHRLVALLTQRGQRVAVAESLTGGLLAAEIVGVPGASVVLTGGVVAYDTELKSRLLGVDAELLARRGPVDPEVARQMADRVRTVCSTAAGPADLGLATTGVAGPDPQGGHPPGTVYVGVASAAGVRAVGLRLVGDRSGIRAEAVARAVAEALAELGGTPRAAAEYPS